MKPNNICTVPNCNNPHKAKGLCTTHYYQQRDITRAAKTAAGQRCHYCRKPSDGKYACSACTKKKSEHERDKRESAIRKGLCIYSGCPNLPMDQRTLCRSHLKAQTAYYLAHKGERALSSTPEYRTVVKHRWSIKQGISTYTNMPFFDAWDPSKGGSFAAGEQWIIENIGRRPEKCDLHIVDRAMGFVPENLQWVPRDQHRRQEMIYKLMLEVQTLRKRNKV